MRTIAFEGQTDAQALHPLHKTSLTIIILFILSRVRAPYSHAASQIPHPEQVFSSVVATTGSIFTNPLVSMLITDEAAPFACATVSGISFGP